MPTPEETDDSAPSGGDPRRQCPRCRVHCRRTNTTSCRRRSRDDTRWHARAANIERPARPLWCLEQTADPEHRRGRRAAAVHTRRAQSVQRRVEPHRSDQQVHPPGRAASQHLALSDADRAATGQSDLPLRVHAQLSRHLHRRAPA